MAIPGFTGMILYYPMSYLRLAGEVVIYLFIGIYFILTITRLGGSPSEPNAGGLVGELSCNDMIKKCYELRSDRLREVCLGAVKFNNKILCDNVKSYIFLD